MPLILFIVEKLISNFMIKSPDIDRGWAYVVLAGYFYVRFLVLGLVWSPGILYSDFLYYFEKSPSMTASAINFNTFFTYSTATISSVFIRAFGPRITTIVGCLFSTLGLLVTSIAPNLIYVFIFYGIITGLGFSMVNTSSYPVVTSYFSEYRIPVLLLASSGVGLGQFILPYIFFRLSNAYSWRGALMIIAGLNLNFLAVAAASMPPRTDKTEESDMSEDLSSCNSEGQRRKFQLISRSSILILVTCLKTSLIKDLGIFRKPFFILVFLSYIFVPLSFVGTITLVKAYGLSNGLSELEATTLISLLGIFSLLGTGTLTLLERASPSNLIFLNVVFLIGIGVCTIILGIVKTKISAYIAVSFIGFFGGTLDAIPVVILSVVGVRDIATGIGYSSVSVAIGCISGGAIGAKLYSVDTTYATCFTTLGVVCIFGASLQIPLVLSEHQACK